MLTYGQWIAKTIKLKVFNLTGTSSLLNKICCQPTNGCLSHGKNYAVKLKIKFTRGDQGHKSSNPFPVSFSKKTCLLALLGIVSSSARVMLAGVKQHAHFRRRRRRRRRRSSWRKSWRSCQWRRRRRRRRIRRRVVGQRQLPLQGCGGL